jgi:sugar lactone lactonase YvrE
MYTKPKGLDADFSANQQSLFVDEPRKRIYYSRCVMDLNEPGKIIGVFKSPEHSLKNNQTLSEFWSKNQALDQIRAVSPDGTVAVSGTHIYNAMEFTVIAELPVPTTAVVFHSDNKTLYFADPVNHQVVGIDYRPKADE